MENFNTTIGVEIHIELKTKSKAFCGCANEFGAIPNSLVCPVCFGLPGAVPNVNKRAIEMTIMAGLIFGSEISSKAIFERKNFFYPDLAKGYQISQWSMPLCKGGRIALSSGKEIMLNRIHLEEDSAKLIHDNESDSTFIDFNRAGVPILEIVAEPTQMTSDEVVEFLNVVRRSVILSGISDCKMEQGQFRYDINISVSNQDSHELGTRVEIINLTSFKSLKHAVDYEVERQIAVLNSGMSLEQETRVWSNELQKTYTSRPKEKVSDYRHFPDPDLKPIIITDEDVKQLKSMLPETYEQKVKKYKGLGIADNYIDIITTENEICDFFESVLKIIYEPTKVANWLVSDVLRIYNEQGKENFSNIISCEDLATIIELEVSEQITRTNAKLLFDEVVGSGRSADMIAKELEIIGKVNDSEVEDIVKSLISTNEELFTEFCKQKDSSILNYYIGEVKKLTGGRVSVLQITNALDNVARDCNS